MKKLIALILVSLLVVSFATCAHNQSSVANQEVLETRSQPDESVIMSDAKFLLRRLPLQGIEHALEIANILYIYNIDGLRRARVTNRIASDVNSNVTHYTFRIVDKYKNTYYVGYSEWGHISLRKIGEEGDWVYLYWPGLGVG